MPRQKKSEPEPQPGAPKYPNRLREMRQKKGLKREDIAVAASVSFEYVRQLEQHRYRPALWRARKIADALNVSLDDVFP
jgi:DNA-binding XRE family transcriptional regulator